MKFSSRFSAVWARIAESPCTVWFCILDSECFTFTLRSSSTIEDGEIGKFAVKSDGKTWLIDNLNLPYGEMNWSTLLQRTADFQESDNAIRGILMACIVSARSQSGKSCVSDALIPQNLRLLSTCIHYDIPIDVDLMTTLADPVRLQGDLYFKCGLGTTCKGCWASERSLPLEILGCKPRNPR